MKRTGQQLLVILAVCLLWATAGFGQAVGVPAQSEGITVSGTGSVAARPNRAEVDLQVSGTAELNSDALVKYRDAKQRVLDVIKKLNLENMSVDETALSITVGNSSEQQQRIINGIVQNPGKSEVQVSSKVRVVLKGIRDHQPEELIKTVGRLLDVAQDAGVKVGPTAAEIAMAYRYGRQADDSAPVRFVLDDLAELRERAYEAAVADARDRAARLAKLHQMKLGPVLSIQELSVGGDSPTTTTVNAYIYQQFSPASPTVNEGPRIVSSSPDNVALQVRLMVRFAIAPLEPATAQK